MNSKFNELYKKLMLETDNWLDDDSIDVDAPVASETSNIYVSSAPNLREMVKNNNLRELRKYLISIQTKQPGRNVTQQRLTQKVLLLATIYGKLDIARMCIAFGAVADIKIRAEAIKRNHTHMLSYFNSLIGGEVGSKAEKEAELKPKVKSVLGIKT